MYDLIDPAITAWAESHGFKVFREFAGSEARFCYTSTAEGECFQVSVDQPLSDLVTVHARDIETFNDEALHESWTGSTADIGAVLEAAVVKIAEWKARPRLARLSESRLTPE